MEKSHSLKANGSSASQKTLCNSETHYRFQKRKPLVPILSQINPFHALHCFLTTSFKIILPSTPRSSKWSHSLRFPH
jgi:hypothetical protein